MPLYNRETLGGKLPWVEIDDFEVIVLDRRIDDGRRILKPSASRELVIVLTGDVAAESELGRVTLRRNDWIQVPPGGVTLHPIVTTEHDPAAHLMRVAGHWTELTLPNLFQVRPDQDLDMHYHDGEEYWIFFRGHGIGISEGKEYKIGPGDMVATGMGYEHGMPESTETVEAVAIETGLYGQRRTGHLHREEHGEPVPARSL